jgi:membrane protein
MAEQTHSERGAGTPLRDTVSTVRAVGTLAQNRNLTYHAAAIAYYAFVSIIPMLLLAVALASYIGGEALANRVGQMLSDQLSSSGQDLVTGALTGTTGRATASLIGLLTLSWSSLKLFRGLDQAFDEIYVDGTAASLPEQIRNAMIVVVGIAFAVVAMVVVGVVLSWLSPDIPFLGLVGTLLLFVTLTLAFLPIYYVLPPVDVSVRQVLPGAALAAVGWLLLQFGFQLYAANAGKYAAYGLIGAVLLFVTWLYFAAIVVLLGAAVNAVRQGMELQTA